MLIFMHPTGFPEARRFADHYLVNVVGNRSIRPSPSII